MRVPLEWLGEFVEDLPDVDELAEGLTLAGLEVEEVERPDPRLADHLVVARLLAVEPHPNADRLSLCTVDTGGQEQRIVCGAKNMAAGDSVVLAQPGAVLPGGVKIKKAKIRGVESCGMLCSASELGLYDEHSGILIVHDAPAAGTPAAPLLGLGAPVLEVGITPNRGDCLSIRGIAREVAAVFALRTTERFSREPGRPSGAPSMSVEIDGSGACPLYRGVELEDVEVGPSPLWMVGRLAACGLRPLANVVDVTNYVLLEHGQPLHAFDRDRLVGNVVRAGRLDRDAEVETLDGQRRKLIAGDTVICDADGIIAVAGVMGGARSAVGEKTRRIFLESAWFDPVAVRRTSRRLGLISESSYRFERGVDPEGVERAMLRAVELLVETAGARAVAQPVAAGEEPPRAAPIRLRARRLQDLLGAPVDLDEAASLLERLEASVERRDGELLVTVPSARRDLEREIDLVEEVARLRGYDRIDAEPPTVAMQEATTSALARLRTRVRQRLAALGMNETVTLAFASPDENQSFPGLFAGGKSVEIANPLRADEKELRRSLVGGLVAAAAANRRNGARVADLFTVGRTFSSHGELECVAGILMGPRRARGPGDAGDPTVFDAKLMVEAIAATASRGRPKWRPSSVWPGAHPGACAEGAIGDRVVAVAATLHPDVAGANDLDGGVAVFEVALGRLAEIGAEPARFAAISRYPSAGRDVSLLVPEHRLAGDVIDVVRELGDPRIEEIRVFDEYRGEGVPDGYRALSFSLTYRAADRTLTDEEIESLHEGVVEELVRKLGVRRRG